MVKVMDCRIVVSEFVLQSRSLSGKNPWERYEPAYPPSYELNSTITVLLGEWIWHEITHKGKTSIRKYVFFLINMWLFLFIAFMNILLKNNLISFMIMVVYHILITFHPPYFKSNHTYKIIFQDLYKNENLFPKVSAPYLDLFILNWISFCSGYLLLLISQILR